MKNVGKFQGLFFVRLGHSEMLLSNADKTDSLRENADKTDFFIVFFVRLSEVEAPQQ
jgi:hypothetical protein